MPLCSGHTSNGQPRPSVQKLTLSGSLNSARKVEAIALSITCIEQRDRLFPADYRHLAALRAEMAAFVAVQS